MSDFTEISNETKTPKWNDGEIHNFFKMVSRTSAGIRRSIHDSYFAEKSPIFCDFLQQI